MSNDNESDEIPVNVVSDNESDEPIEESESSEPIKENLSELLDAEKQKTSECEEKLKHILADFQNLSRKTQSDIENVKIYDDFIRARDVFYENKINTEGLDSILKNMDSLLKKYDVAPIDALGEIFDPNLHEAIS
ncbi:Protein GrpE, partial [Marine Group I thaumarchaeote SCGC RSA3]